MINAGSDNQGASVSNTQQPAVPENPIQSPTEYPSQLAPPGYPIQSPTEYPSQPAPPAGYPAQEVTEYPPQPATVACPQKPALPGYLPGYPHAQPVYHTTHNSQPGTHITNTTVVIQQPQLQLVVDQQWHTSLGACFDDVSLCVLGCLCPCVLPCVISCKAGECCCVGSCLPVALRVSVRERHNIKGDICGDCCAMCWCSLCAFCQMGRELDFRK